ncbi:MAG: nitrilase-related carbon-nitrogen hydrolase [Bacillota bacterium]|nr:nitrilase-related carbon-nitrogen hydrolase [Bacillota bacterium]
MLSSWKERLLLHYLFWKTRSARFQRYLQGKSSVVKGREMRIDRRKIRAVAVQQKLELYTEPLHYAEQMRLQVEKAVQMEAHLVVFPENNGIQLLGMLPGIKKLAGKGETSLEGRTGQLSVLDVLCFVGPVIEKAARTIFSLLAAKYNVYIMAGSFLHPDGEKVVNRSYLFGPDGNLLGTQDKVHLFPTEQKWGINSGERFHVFQTPIGNLSMPVCMDATYFETFRILQLMGAEIVMVPIANAEPYHFYLALRGIWPRVQETLVYGIRSALVGSFLGFNFTGKAGIFAPIDLTPKKDGILAESLSHINTDLVTADLDLEALHELRAAHPYLGDKNPELYEKYFPGIYLNHSSNDNQDRDCP